MYCMFYQCSEFNADLSEWDVWNVRNMCLMFYECAKFNADLSGWDVSDVDTRYMFGGWSRDRMVETNKPKIMQR